MGGRRRRARPPEGEFDAVIDSVGHDGRGVARVDGKATFIHGALPGEQVKFRYLQRRRNHDEGQVVSVISASPDRVEPRCAHYGVCGGCSLQHLDSAAQVSAKQGVLLDNFRQIGRVAPDSILPPLVNDEPWGYRRKARLGVKNVTRKEKVLVGFRERGSSYVADLARCEVLHPRVGTLLPALSALIESLSINNRVPQIEMAMDDDRCVLILRLLEPLSGEDEQALNRFQQTNDVVFYLQPGGPDSVVPLSAEVDLRYALPDYDVTLSFLPGDFTQVNTEINRKMVARALDLLDPQPDDQVLDLFCGIGNFTLPIARSANAVVGVEGDAGLVERARANAERNGLHNATFYTADLYGELQAEPWMKQRFNKVLLDPPRSGALQVLPYLSVMGVQRIVYVSCYPGTLARDAGELVGKYGYRLVSAGVMDMFPHTAHVESIALFEKG
ncbi:23S rRNA (uracil(1939)-C(5))-methyltransferase RlmD [Thiosocius teredinicola]|uniref:23S rRNA (uracil(1939)-C(5))-methyltransferase RlmD n=1 Tax=Thiosocius teredinicola TaxID=1973002 RepID=UPI000990A805